jgi:hypothetical protein
MRVMVDEYVEEPIEIDSCQVRAGKIQTLFFLDGLKTAGVKI